MRKVEKKGEEDIDKSVEVPRYPIIEVSEDRYTVYIFDEITKPSEFIDICDLLDNANEGTTITFKINSPGGYLHTIITILDHIKNTKATTIAECSGIVASAATVWALACDALYIADYTTFMQHTYSSGPYGKGHEVVADVAHESKNLGEFIHTYYKKFLSKKEIRRLLKGEDFYFTKSEVEERWERVLQYRSALQKKRQKQIEKQQLKTDITKAKQLLKEHGNI